jgi:arylsulfatase A-like enzyme/Tfp pilus assembly protein PilF
MSFRSPRPIVRAASGRAPRRAGRVTAILVAGVTLATLLGFFAWRSPRSTTSSSGTTLGRLPAGVSAAELNLVVITLDTTRADRLRPYGYADIETPALDRLANDGVLFERASTTAPLTLPAHSTIFTGRFPPTHGVRDNGGFFLAPSQTTLAESLKAKGFATGAFVGAYVLDSKWGLDQGFDTYFDDFDLTKYRAISMGAIQRRGDAVVDRGLQWLEGNHRSRFFAWMHLYDPHTPYDPPEPYKSRYADRPYVGEIAYVDAQIGRVIRFLEDRALLDRTVIVVVGDHGESLNEHGEASHGFFIYDSVLRVPLIIRTPFSSMRGRRVTDVVRTTDIMPTVAEMLGMRTPDGVEGVSLVPLMTGSARDLGLEAYSESLYPLHHYGWSDLRALRSGRFKLIASPKPELFDLEQDPDERQNVFDARRALGDRMLARLRELEAQFAAGGTPDQGPVEVDPDARARLAALGYVGSFTASVKPDENRTGLADPKEKIGLFNLISAARDLSSDDGKFDEVVGMLQRVLREDPAVVDAWFMLGNIHAKVNKQEQAIDYFKKALSLKPDAEMAVVNMANAYRQIGLDEEALVGYRRFLELDPRNSQVRYEVAQILIDRRQFPEARQMLTEALTNEPKLVAARNALGVIALNEGNLPAAEQEIRAALAQKPDVRLAHYNLALIAERQGDARTAEAEYLRELELHPTNFKASFNLGRLYEQLGNPAAQESAWRKAIESNPRFAEGHFYLAKLYLKQNRQLDEAVALAKRGLEIGKKSEFAPLGHYVLADIYSRRGLAAESRREAERGRALEKEAAARVVQSKF